MGRSAYYGVLMLSLLLLGGCESTKSFGDSVSDTWSDWFSTSNGSTAPAAENVTVRMPAACPPVSVPKEVSEWSLGGTAPLDMKALVHITATSTDCDIEQDSLRQTVSLKLDATKGPALKQDELSVPFFLAVTGPNGAVLAKKMYQTTFAFSGELTDSEELSVVFTLTAEQAAAANLYAGLGLDPADLPPAE